MVTVARPSASIVSSLGGDNGISGVWLGGGAMASRLVGWAVSSTGGCSNVATVARRSASIGPSWCGGGGAVAGG